MKKVSVNSGSTHTTEFRPETKYSVAPKIASTYMDGLTRMYVSVLGIHIVADVYDRTWIPLGGKVHGKKHKGENANKKMASLL